MRRSVDQYIRVVDVVLCSMIVGKAMPKYVAQRNWGASVVARAA